MPDETTDGFDLADWSEQTEQKVRVDEYEAETAKPENTPIPEYDAQTLRVSLAVGPVKRTNADTKPTDTKPINGSFGVDTLRFWIPESDYTEADNAPFEEKTKTHTVTGEMTVLKAYNNTDTVRLTKHGDKTLLIEASLPKLLRHTNELEVGTGSQIALSINALERAIKAQGVTADLYTAKLSRVDIARTVELPRSIDQYEDALRLCGMPRTTRKMYRENGYRWANKQRQITVYDKGRELSEDDSPTNKVRVEYRLLRAESVDTHLAAETIAELLGELSRPATAYTDAVERLTDAAPNVDALHTKRVGAQAYSTAVNALKDERGAYSKALTAMAVGACSTSDLEQMENIVQKELGRQAAYRFKNKVQDIQPIADAFRDDTEAVSTKLRELRSHFMLN